MTSSQRYGFSAQGPGHQGRLARDPVPPDLRVQGLGLQGRLVRGRDLPDHRDRDPGRLAPRGLVSGVRVSSCGHLQCCRLL